MDRRPRSPGRRGRHRAGAPGGHLLHRAGVGSNPPPVAASTVGKYAPAVTEARVSKTFIPSGFFALRTPLLPFEEILTWGEGLQAPTVIGDGASGSPEKLEQAFAADRARLRGRLRDLVRRPEVREALFVASPDLDESLEVWMSEPDGGRGHRIERGRLRYFVRMPGRPTPFGVFAGCSVGELGPATCLVIEARKEYRRHTRLDMDYLCALSESLVRDPQLRKTLVYRPNSSLYRAAGRLHYAEARLLNKTRSHHLVAIEATDYLEASLGRASEGARPQVLAEALVASEAGVTMEEAWEFVNELIDSQILVPDLEPAVTGPEPIHGLLAHLRRHPPAAVAAERLEQTREALETLDAAGLGADPGRYRAIARRLEELPAGVELPRLFQVDMVKPSAGATLGEEPLAEMVRGVEILHRLAGPLLGDR